MSLVGATEPDATRSSRSEPRPNLADAGKAKSVNERSVGIRVASQRTAGDRARLRPAHDLSAPTVARVLGFHGAGVTGHGTDLVESHLLRFADDRARGNVVIPSACLASGAT